MTNVKMRALDQLHISALQADSLQPDEEFEVSTAEADRLEEAGLAKRVGGAKAEREAPANKAEKAAPENKSRKIIGAEGLTRTASRSAKPKGKK